MPYAATYVMNPKKREVIERKTYKKEGTDFTPVFKQKLYEQYVPNVISEENDYLIRNIKSTLGKLSKITEKNKIRFSVEKFLNNTSHKVKYSVNRSLDSDYYIVEIQEDNLTFEELFNLARQLNRDAVKSGLNFVVIAGV